MDLSKFGWISNWSDSVKTARANKQFKTPTHKLPTDYRYNTLNQVVSQKSPDGGITEFWYDRLGRLAISRNARQKAAVSTSLYSYTKYDYLGRITEVGQIKNTTASDTMKDVTSRNPTTLYNWLQSRTNNRGQITQTIYDLAYTGFTGVSDSRLIIQQRNLRNRVSYVTLTDTATTAAYSAGTFYSYDIHGNVDSLLQDYGVSNVTAIANILNRNNNRWKKTVYKYDLISGKVNMVMYQPGWGDQFIHRYSYDAENRLILAETSRDSLIWEREARYEYYRHGPLARMIIGEQLVQGVDYAYTLQGWLKGTNSSGALALHDMGGDGRSAGEVLNRYTARDAFSYTLNYYAGDHASINTSVMPFPGSSAYLNANYRPLYNGNISSMATTIRKMIDPNMMGGPILLYNYKYDQLNRLTGMDAYNGFDSVNNNWTGSGTIMPSYKERVAYDGNGNILKYLRHGNSTGFQPVMDSLTYKYYSGTNQLRQVSDSVPDNAWGAGANDFNFDIDKQTVTNNYVYDQIGNLTSDAKENITSIKWSVYGKILEINRTATSQKPVTKIVYRYDSQGNRIGKIISKTGTSVRDHTWYVRDAQGNVMATYTASGNVTDANLNQLILVQAEKHIYGSSRLGINSWAEPVDNGPYDMANFNFVTSIYKRGWRQYELSNHLGNVLVTISDKKIGIPLPSSSLIDYYEPVVVSAQDYYPFGMLMPKRSYASAAGYRYGFNGKETDNDVKGLGNQQDYGFRIYDPRLGRFLSVDPISKKFPFYSPYQFAGNRPIVAIDLDGLEDVLMNDRLANSSNTALLLRIRMNTTFGKEFVTALKSQNKVDVLYYTFSAKEMSPQGEISDVTFFREGFIYGTKGQTNFVRNKAELDKLRRKDYLVSSVNPKDIENSLNTGKSVVLIGISEAIIDKIDEIAKKQILNPDILKKEGWTDAMTRNLIGDAAHTIQHEENSHAIKKVKANNDASDPLTDHFEYQGEISTTTPSAHSIITNPKYNKTKAFKSIAEIIKSMKAISEQRLKSKKD